METALASLASGPRVYALAPGIAPNVRLAGGSEGELLRKLSRTPQRFWDGVRRQSASVWVVSNVRGYYPREFRSLVGLEPEGVLYHVRPTGR